MIIGGNIVVMMKLKFKRIHIMFILLLLFFYLLWIILT